MEGDADAFRRSSGAGNLQQTAASNGAKEKEEQLTRSLALVAALAIATGPAVAHERSAAAGPTDAQIAHIAYTAGNIDVDAAKLALEKSHNTAVREFAEEMVRDHQAVNEQALELVKKLGVTPQANATSEALSKQAAETQNRLVALDGPSFDRAYAANEIAYHKAVNGALKTVLIPSADNGELKSLLETGLTLFGEHQKHAEHLTAELK
jgi:putative membrane protein